jgi:hypothetical protein
MVEPNVMLNDRGSKSVAFIQRWGSIHLAIVALPPLTCQYPPEADEAKALRILEKAEQSCLVTNSMTARRRLTATVRVGPPSPP